MSKKDFTLRQAERMHTKTAREKTPDDELAEAMMNQNHKIDLKGSKVQAREMKRPKSTGC